MGVFRIPCSAGFRNMHHQLLTRFSARLASRRNASARLGRSGSARRQASIWSKSEDCSRTITGVPVSGARGRFCDFVVSRVDLAMKS